MPVKRLIDRVPSVQDECRAPNEWLLLMEPFVDALNAPAEIAAASAYVHQEGGSPHWRYLALKLSGVLSLGTRPETVGDNFSALRHGRRPTLIVGEPGVGKTTWLMNFFSRREVQDHAYAYRFDGRTGRSSLSDVAPDRYVRAKLREGIVSAQQEAGRRRNVRLPVHEVSPYQTDHAAVEQAVLVSAGRLRERGMSGYLILDNFDRRPRDEQRLAVEYAHHAHAHLGLGAIVALRPYSVRDQNLHDFESVTVRPPSFQQVIRARVELARNSTAARALLQTLRKSLRLEAAWCGVVANESDLERLWDRTADALTTMPILQNFLHRIHLADLHAIFHDLGELLATGHFANELLRRLSGHAGGNDYDCLTAYLRGDYRHHRAAHRSGEAIVNLFQADRSERDQLLYFRMLQFLRRAGVGNASVRYSDLRRDATVFGYTPEAVDRVAGQLVKCRLILEVQRMADYENNSFCVEGRDELVLSESGDYYLDELVKEPRYIQAMAHVTALRQDVVEREMQPAVSVEAEYWNAYVLMREVGEVLLRELHRLRRDKLLDRFFKSIDSGRGFWCSGVEACQEVVGKLAAQGKLSRDLEDRWRSLNARVVEVRQLKQEFSAEAA